MCGVAGAIGFVTPEVEAAVRAMSEAQVHRGPDDSGFHSSGVGPGAAFGFRRLAILDLSAAGHQPMHDAARGNVVVFNGEIYNHSELRDELTALGESFESTSDTEVLLRAYGRWGPAVLERLRGMFAFAIHDESRRRVLLARDRLGIKPLYLAELSTPGGRVVLFASELRAMLASGLVARRLDPAALASFAWNGFVVGPCSMLAGVSLLPSGTYVEIDPARPSLELKRYWSLASRSRRPGDATERLRSELFEATKQHLVSDVPIGVFLSGGVDSSAIAAMAARARKSSVETFHIGFEEAKFDESAYARAVAQALGTKHSEFRLTQALFLDGLETALRALDQPTFDALNTYFVSRVVREAGFTVALAGTGGDELFGGYPSFRDLPRAMLAKSMMPDVGRRTLAATARFVVRALGGDGVPPQTRWAKLGDLVDQPNDLLAAYQVAYGLFTRDFLQTLIDPTLFSQAPSGIPPERARELRECVSGMSPLSAVSAFELALFLGERLLRDSDAASMAVSLELRVPLLDHRVVEAAFDVTDTVRFRPLGKKSLLRELAMPELSPALFQRPKAGFVLPIEVWAKDRLADDMQATFANRALCASVGFDAATLDRLFGAFRAQAPGIYWSRVWAPYVLLRWCQAHAVSLNGGAPG